MPKTPIEDQISCVRREVARREQTYPAMVEAGRLKEEKSAYEIAVMKHVDETLTWLRDNRPMIKRFIEWDRQQASPTPRRDARHAADSQHPLDLPPKE